MDSTATLPKTKVAIALVYGLLVGVVVTGVAAYLYINRTISFPNVSEPSLIKGVHIEEDTGNVVINVDMDVYLHLLETKSSLERTVRLEAITSGKNSLELLDLFVQFESLRPTRFRDEVQSAVIRRVAQLEPRNALDNISTLAEVRQIPLVEIVFQEWSVAELDKSIEFARTMEVPYQTAALEGILGSRIDLPKEERHVIALQLGSERVILDQWAVSQLQDGIEDPLIEWSKFLKDHGSDVVSLSAAQRSLFVNIARAWMDRDGFVAMIQQMSTSLADYDSCVSAIVFLLNEVELDVASVAIELSANMSSEASSMVLQAIRNLAASDPERAMEIATIMRRSDYGIVFQRTAIGAWIENDPIAVLQAKSSLPEEFWNWIDRSSLLNMVHTNPDAVPQFIPTIKDQRTMELVVTNLITNWAREDPMAVFEWVQSEPRVQQWHSNAIGSVIHNLSKQDPERAIRFALEQPPRDFDGVGWETSVVYSVAQSDVDAAVALIDHARDEKTRDDMYQSIGQLLANQGQYQRAMDWAENLKEEQRDEYYERVVVSWADWKPEQLYENMDSLPSDELRAIAADWLISLNEHQRAFNEEQIESLKKHLPPEGTDP